jgi:hypothetical protein
MKQTFRKAIEAATLRFSRDDFHRSITLRALLANNQESRNP